MKSPITIPSEHVRPLTIHGMTGRMVHIPNAESNKVFIYIHGLHTSAERHYSLCDYLSDFGTVYAPDLPGFGGMDSFYKIGLKPSYDNFADYVYTVIKSLDIKPDQKITLVGMSYGSQVMTRLLQKYPDMQKRVDNAISLAGFGSGKDFKTMRAFKIFMYPVMFFGSRKFGSKAISLIAFNPISIRIMIGFFVYTSPKLKNDNSNTRRDLFRMECYLWQIDDTRTHSAAGYMMFTQDLKQHSKAKISTRMHNVMIEEDQYFVHENVNKTFNALYEKYECETISMGAHAPSIVADKHAVAAFFPEATRKLLSA